MPGSATVGDASVAFASVSTSACVAFCFGSSTGSPATVGSASVDSACVGSTTDSAFVGSTAGSGGVGSGSGSPADPGSAANKYTS